MANNAFGIDLGTSNIKIYNRADDNVFVEKNMIAIENKRTLFAYGNSAFDMYEKTPGNIQITYPLSNGVIADIQNMETLIKYFMIDLMKGGLRPADYYIAVPWDVTEVEKRAFKDLVKESNVKAKKVMVVDKAVADGLGLGIDVKNSQGVLVVNVGFDTTEISILSLRDIVTGLPVEREIPTSLVNECLTEHFNTIIDNIKVILERTPPELAADIYRHGVYLTGGASQVNNLAQLMSKGTGLKVNLSEHPIESVALGLAKIINEDNYKSVAYAIEGMSK